MGIGCGRLCLLALGASFALLALGAGGPADAHRGLVAVQNAEIVGPHTIKITYTDNLGSSADGTAAQQALYAQRQAMYDRFEAGDRSACRELADSARQNPHGFYTNLVLSPGGSRDILFVEDGGANSDLLHLDPCAAVPDGSTAAFHIGLGTWRSEWRDSGGHSACDSRTCGGGPLHVHTVRPSTVHAADGQPPRVSGQPSLGLGSGSLIVHFSESVDKTGADTSKFFVTLEGASAHPMFACSGGACSMSLSGAWHTTGTGRALSIAMQEAQRSALTSVQDEDLKLEIRGGIADSAGNRADASGIDVAVLRDTRPPQMDGWLSGTPALDLGAGTLTLFFTEYIDTSRADASGVRLEGPSGRHVSLGGASVGPDSDRVTFTLTPAQKAAVMDPASFPRGVSYGFRDQGSFPDARPKDSATSSLYAAPGSFRDAAGIAFVPVPGLDRVNQQARGDSHRFALDAQADRTPPRIAGEPSLFLGNDGTIRIELDEYVRARTADLSKISVSGAGAAVELGADSTLKSDGDTLLIGLSEAQRQKILQLPGALALETADGSILDIAGNSIAASSTALSVIPDRQGPGFVSASIDEATGALELVFSEAVDVTPASRVDLDEFGIRAAHEGLGDAVRLSSPDGAAAVSTESDDEVIALALTEAQRAAVAAHGADALLLDMGAGAVRDTSGNPVAPLDGLHLNASADRTAPSASSASLDEGTGVLSVTFDETVDATPAYLVDLSKMWLREAGATARTQLSGASAGGADGTVVEITLTEAQRRDAVLYAAGPLLDIAPGAVADSAGNRIGQTDGLPVSVSGADASPPSLAGAALDMGTGVLELQFDEFLDSRADASKVSVRQGASSVALSGATASGLDGAVATITMSEQMRRAVASFSSPVLDLEPGAVRDVSQNPSGAVSGYPISSALDTTPPEIESASVAGPSSISVLFSEDLADSSVDAGDFEVRGHTVVSASEDGGAVTVGLGEQISRASGETLRVRMAGPVSDAAGNALEVADGHYYDVALDFASASAFTVGSDNARSGLARTGDTVTVTFTADAAIVAATASDVKVNSRNSIITDTRVDGFTATYEVKAADRDGPLDIEVTVRTAGADPTTSVFTEADLTGDNVAVDNTGPRALSAELAGFQSVYVHFDEAVLTEDADYTDIVVGSVGGLQPPRGASSATGSGDSQHILVMWDLDMDDRIIGSPVTFSVGAGVTDLAGNALQNPGPMTVEAITDHETITRLHLSSPADGGESHVALAHDTLIRKITTHADTTPVIDVSNFMPSGSHEDIAHVEGEHVVFPPGDGIEVLTHNSRVQFPPEVHVGGFDADLGHTIKVHVSARTPSADFAAAHPHIDTGSAHVLEFGHPDVDLFFSKPIRVTLTQADIRHDSAVFSMDADHVTRLLLECGEEVVDVETAEAFIGNSVAPRGSDSIDGGACVDHEHNVIWTEHFSAFGSASPGEGGSDCSDCTSPTLGVTSDGTRVVSGGFSYNGSPVDVDLYFTDYPRITVEVGSENTAVLKIYDEDGADAISHASIAFGLRSGQSMSEGRAAIAWDRNHAGEQSVTVTDPDDAIQDGVAVEASEAPCMEGSPDTCLLLEITHTFRAPLEFDMVGTNVWDADRNGWQNYFNHGVRVTGESLNEAPGVAANGGALTLYPMRDGSERVDVMSDGAGLLYLLGGDGQYRPLSNSSALYHAVDESMWEYSMSGPGRADAGFASLLESQELAAMAVLDGMSRGAPFSNPDFGAPAALVHHEQSYGDRSEDAALQESILREQARAAQLYAALFED